MNTAKKSDIQDGTITFFVGSDIHYKGNNGKERKSAQTTIDDMNSLPGKAYPTAIGNMVEEPNFIAFVGDETDNGIEIAGKLILQKALFHNLKSILLFWPDMLSFTLIVALSSIVKGTFLPL